MKIQTVPPHEDDILEVVVATTAAAAGEFRPYGVRVGCHQNGGAVGDTDQIAVGGQYRVTKIAGAVWVPGQIIYKTVAAQTFTHAVTVEVAGFAVKDAASADVVGYIKLAQATVDT